MARHPPPPDSDGNVFKLFDKATYDEPPGVEPSDPEGFQPETVWQCACLSRRYFLTPRGPECVYCGKLATEWMNNG